MYLYSYALKTAIAAFCGLVVDGVKGKRKPPHLRGGLF
nr:MAG TPA: hypothetical protein [Caudoviricetes sp.]